MSKKGKKGSSAASVFLRGFFKSLLVIGLLFLTGFASYKVSLFYFNERGVTDRGKVSELLQELYGGAEAEAVSKNLIYGIDSTNGHIKSMVLEVFNTNTHNMDYITIPVKTQFTISNEMYEKLLKAGCEAPQIIKLSAIYKYFSKDTMYDYGVLILNDLLGIDISYYTVVDQKSFKTAFKKSTQREVLQTGDNAVVQSVSTWVYKDHYRKKLKKLVRDEKAVKDYLEVLYESCNSSLPLLSKKQYAADYVQWEVDNTYFYVLPGFVRENSFEAKDEDAKKLLEEILGNATHTFPQQLTDTAEADSRGCTIEILNASQITGLAAKYQELLEEQGYTVSSIGNYMGMLQTTSSILVRNGDTGSDLLLYLEGAQLTVSDNLPEGTDIQIILGTDADRQ